MARKLSALAQTTSSSQGNPDLVYEHNGQQFSVWFDPSPDGKSIKITAYLPLTPIDKSERKMVEKEPRALYRLYASTYAVHFESGNLQLDEAYGKQFTFQASTRSSETSADDLIGVTSYDVVKYYHDNVSSRIPRLVYPEKPPEFTVILITDAALPVPLIYWNGAQGGGREGVKIGQVAYYEVQKRDLPPNVGVGQTSIVLPKSKVREILEGRTPVRISEQGFDPESYEATVIESTSVDVLEGQNTLNVPLKEAWGRKVSDTMNGQMFLTGHEAAPPAQIQASFKTGEFKIPDGFDPGFDIARFDLEVLKALRYLKLFPEIKIRIVGHTDRIGTEASNLDLSKKRAEALASYMSSPERWGPLALQREQRIQKVEGKGEEQAKMAGMPKDKPIPKFRKVELVYSRGN